MNRHQDSETDLTITRRDLLKGAAYTTIGIALGLDPLGAEAAAKSILIRGSLDGLDWLEANPALAGLLILEDGQILYSQKIMEYL